MTLPRTMKAEPAPGDSNAPTVHPQCTHCGHGFSIMVQEDQFFGRHYPVKLRLKPSLVGNRCTGLQTF